MDRQAIGKRLAEARKMLGFTQKQVAEYLEVPRESIAYIETGARPVNTLTLSKLADLYGYKLSYFLEEERMLEKPHVSMAFMVAGLSENDLKIIAEIKRITSNLDSLYKLLGVVSNV